MAIIRIVIGVQQQQIRQQQIHKSKSEYFTSQGNRMERQDRLNNERNAEDNVQMSQERQRGFQRNIERGQMRDYRLGSHNNNVIRQVPAEIRPFMIELEASQQENPNNVTVYNPQPSQYTIINPNNLQVNLITSQKTTPNLQQRSKQTVFDKIIIFGIVWQKQVNGLFDYQQKSKNQKSTIVIEDDVKGCINFIQTVEESLMPKPSDTYLLIFKNKDKMFQYERKSLMGIQITALKRQQNKSTILSENDKQFLCALKLVMNTVTNQFSIKVFSYNELRNQVKVINKLKITTEIANLSLSLPDVQQNISNPNKHEPYFIVRSISKTEPKGKKLYPGDLIKLGKVQFKVMSIDGVSIEDKNSQEDRKALEVTQIDEETESQIQCKYCLGGKSQEENNFFLHLCNCKGHIAYVHYNCLTTWTKTKASIQSSQNVKLYFLEKMKCQVCLQQFPKYFKYKGKIFHILPMQIPQKHMLLVDVSQRQDAIIAVLSGDTDKSIVVGRGRSSHLRVSDITVSREHANIQRIGDDYFIKDCKSKFGTLVRSSEKELQEGIQHKKGFQINNVIFTVQVMTKQIQIQPQGQQQIQLLRKTQDIENENEQKQQKAQKTINENNQQTKKIIAQHKGKYESSKNEENQNKDFYQLQQELENYPINNQNINIEQEIEQNTRSTKRSVKKIQVNGELINDERSNQTSAFRKRTGMKLKSRNENEQKNDELSQRQNTIPEAKRKRNDNSTRDLSK